MPTMPAEFQKDRSTLVGKAKFQARQWIAPKQVATIAEPE